MAGKGSRTISMILAIIMVLGLFPSLGPSAGAELQEIDPFSVTYGIPTTGLVDAPAGIPLLTETVPQHAHHFTYSAEGNTIVAHCDATDCTLENGEARLVLKTDDAAKADHPYTGASVQNTIPLSENAVLGPVVYYSLNESELVETGAQPESFLTEENRLEIAPKRVGTYLASVTLTVDGTDYTVWNVFEIYLPKAAITVRPEPVEGLVYDGQPHALVTPGEAGGNAVLYAVLANDETEPTEGFDDTFPMAADAGLYVVWFRAAGDADHEDGDTDHVVVRIQKAAQAAPSAPEAEEITAESITLKASEGYEYSMDGETWQNDNTFAGLTADTEYRFFQRITGDYNLEPSPAGEAAVFRTLEAAPVAEAEAKPVKLWFVCDPPETVLSVRSSAEGSSPVSPEEDGSYLLLPGSWICSAAAEGYQPIENSEFTVSAENGDTQYMTLELQKLPPLVSPAFEETTYVSGMAVRVSAPEGVFPEGSTLSVTPVPVQEQQFVDAAVGSERGGSKNVMVSYTFDIKVIGPDGNEVQPADAQKVKVSFTANAVAEQNLSTDVYHVSGEGASLCAERLDTTEDGATVTAETSGFSYYTVEFTYETLQYVLPGGENVALSEILNTVGLSGTVTGVQCSRPDLFSADTRSGEWVVYSHQPFTSTEWMKIVINGLEYTIIVTDAGGGADVTFNIQSMNNAPLDKVEITGGAAYIALSISLSSDSSAYDWRFDYDNSLISVLKYDEPDGPCRITPLLRQYKDISCFLTIQLIRKADSAVVSSKELPVIIKGYGGTNNVPVISYGVQSGAELSGDTLTINLAATSSAVISINVTNIPGYDGIPVCYDYPGWFDGATKSGATKTGDCFTAVCTGNDSGSRFEGTVTITPSKVGSGELEYCVYPSTNLKDDEVPLVRKTVKIKVIDDLNQVSGKIRLLLPDKKDPGLVIDIQQDSPSVHLDLEYVTLNSTKRPSNYKWVLVEDGPFECKMDTTTFEDGFTLTYKDTKINSGTLVVRLVHKNSNVTWKQQAFTVKLIHSKSDAVDAANKESKEISGSAPSGGNSTGGSTPVAPGGGTGNKLEKTAKNVIPIKANAKLAMDLEYFRKHANELDKQKQLYKLSWISYTDKNGKPQKVLSYMTGTCNYSAYTTLLNRFVAYHYGDYSSPVKAENILYQDKGAVPEPYTFYKTGGTAHTSFNKDATRKFYVVDGKETSVADYNKAVEGKTNKEKEKYKKDHGVKIVQTVVQSSFKYGNSTATEREGWVTNAGFRLPQQDFVYKNGNYSIKVDGIETSPVSKKTKNSETINLARESCKTPEMLAYLLKEHPEGIYIHATNSSGQHAVVITDCKETKDTKGNTTYTFYVIDPATKSSNKGEKPTAMPCTDSKSVISSTSSLKINQIDHIYYLYDGKDTNGKNRTINVGAETLVKMLAESKKVS